MGAAAQKRRRVLATSKQTYEHQGYLSHGQQSVKQAQARAAIVAEDASWEMVVDPRAVSQQQRTASPPSNTFKGTGYLQHLQNAVQQHNRQNENTYENNGYLSFLQSSVAAAQKHRAELLLSKITYTGTGYMSHLQSSFVAAANLFVNFCVSRFLFLVY